MRYTQVRPGQAERGDVIRMDKYIYTPVVGPWAGIERQEHYFVIASDTTNNGNVRVKSIGINVMHVNINTDKRITGIYRRVKE